MTLGQGKKQRDSPDHIIFPNSLGASRQKGTPNGDGHFLKPYLDHEFIHFPNKPP